MIARRAVGHGASSRPASHASSAYSEFDLGAAPSIEPAALATLETCAWIDAGEPVVRLGDSGTGKSHVLIGLGLAAAETGRRVRYVTTAALANELAEAADERTPVPGGGALWPLRSSLSG